MDRDFDAEDEDETPPAKSGQLLKSIGQYAMYAAPVIAVAALGVALIAVMGNRSQSASANFGDLTARVASLDASLANARNEVDLLKLALARERNMRAEERKKVEEQTAIIVQSVTRLQVKLKIAPTLEMQLQQAASAPAAAKPVPAPAAAPVAAGHKAAAPAPESVAKKAVVPAAKAAGKKPVPAKPEPSGKHSKKTTVTPSRSKAKPAPGTSDQVKALRQAIEKFNQQ